VQDRQQVQAAGLLNRIPAQPPAQGGAVGAVFVENQIGGGIGPLGREAEGVQGGSGPGHADRFSEGAVFVAGGFSTSICTY